MGIVRRETRYFLDVDKDEPIEVSMSSTGMEIEQGQGIITFNYEDTDDLIKLLQEVRPDTSKEPRGD